VAPGLRCPTTTPLSLPPSHPPTLTPPRTARRFRQTGRHTARVAKFTITVVIGVVVGAVAFSIETAVDAITTWRLRGLSLALADAEAAGVDFAGTLIPAWLSIALSGASLAFLASALVVVVAPAATGAGVALVMATLNGVDVPKARSVRSPRAGPRATPLARCTPFLEAFFRALSASRFDT